MLRTIQAIKLFVMSEAAYYEADLSTFFSTNENEVLGELAAKHRFDLESGQRHAWQQQIRILKTSLSKHDAGRIYFEFSIPRMGKRADVVLLIEGIVFVVEFKVGASTVNRASIEQVHDYALDLKNFHKGSHHVSIVPIVLPTEVIKLPAPTLIWADDDVATPLAAAPVDLAEIINAALSQRPTAFIDHFKWSHSGYQPTPTISVIIC